MTRIISDGAELVEIEKGKIETTLYLDVVNFVCIINAVILHPLELFKITHNVSAFDDRRLERLVALLLLLKPTEHKKQKA